MLVDVPEEYWNICIPDPEFKYIFTIDLGGRIVDKKKIFDEIRVNPPAPDVDGRTTIERRYIRKEHVINFRGETTEDIYYMLNMEESTVRHYIDRYLLKHSTPLRWFLNKKIANDLLKKSLTRFKNEKARCGSCKRPHKEECAEYINFHKRLVNDIFQKEEEAVEKILLYKGEWDDDRSEDFRLAGIELKLFRAGALSILIRVRWPGLLTLDDCLNFIRYPENIVIKQNECYLGPLNSFAHLLAEEVYNDFRNSKVFSDVREKIINCFVPLDENKKLEFKKLVIDESYSKNDTDNIALKLNSYVGVFCPQILEVEIDRDIHKKEFINSNVYKELINEKIIIELGDRNDHIKLSSTITTKNELEGRLKKTNLNQDEIKLILSIWHEYFVANEEYKKIEEKVNVENNAILNKNRYIKKRKREYLKNIIYKKFNTLRRHEISWWDSEKGQKSVISIANTTPEYTKFFRDPLKYITKKNIARGNEIIMLERRSWIIASNRLHKDSEESTRYRIGIVECLLYSLEAIIATTLAIETYNEHMEEIIKPVSHEFNTAISESFNPGIIENFSDRTKLAEFVTKFSRARSISPCEDIITSMEAHLISSTSIKAIEAMRDVLELNSLISLARERMKNYGYFLQTGHHILISEEQKLINKKLLEINDVQNSISVRLEKETRWIQILTIGLGILTLISTFFAIMIYLTSFYNIRLI